MAGLRKVNGLSKDGSNHQDDPAKENLEWVKEPEGVVPRWEIKVFQEGMRDQHYQPRERGLIR